MLLQQGQAIGTSANATSRSKFGGSICTRLCGKQEKSKKYSMRCICRPGPSVRVEQGPASPAGVRIRYEYVILRKVPHYGRSALLSDGARNSVARRFNLRSGASPRKYVHQVPFSRT